MYSTLSTSVHHAASGMVQSSHHKWLAHSLCAGKNKSIGPYNWGPALCKPLPEPIPAQMHPLGCKNGLFGSFDIFGTQSFICRHFYGPNKSDISCYTHAPWCYRLADTRPAQKRNLVCCETHSRAPISIISPSKAHGIIDGRFFEKSCHLCSTDLSTTLAEFSCVISSDGPGLWRSAYLAGRGILEHTIAGRAAASPSA